MAAYTPTGFADLFKPIVPATPTAAAAPYQYQLGTIPNSLQGVERANLLGTLPGAEHIGTEATGANLYRLPDSFFGNVVQSPDHPHIRGFAEARGWQLTPENYSSIADSFYHKRGNDTDRNQQQQAAALIAAGFFGVPAIAQALGATGAGAAGAAAAGGGFASQAAGYWGGLTGLGGAGAAAGAGGGGGAAGPATGVADGMQGVLDGLYGPVSTAAGGGAAANGAGGWLQTLLGGGSRGDQILSGLGMFSDIYGQYQQGQQNDDVLWMLQGAQLGDINFGGGGVSANNQGFNLGPLSGVQQGAAGAAGQQFSGINFASGIPPEIAQSLSGFRQFLNPALAGYGRNMFAGADALGGELGRGYQSVYDSTLANLREGAIPENQRTVNSALSRLFSQGRLGSTGGMNDLGRLAEVQNRQDLDFQLAAGGESRAAAASVADRFRALVAGGGDVTRLGSDLAGEDLGFSRDMASLPRALRGEQLGEVGNLLSLFSGLQQEGYNAFNTGLNYQSTRSDAANRVGTNIGGFVGSPTYDASPVASAFGSIFSTRAQNRQMEELFRRLQGSV